MLRRAFFASAFGVIAGLFGLAAGPKKVRVIERLESGRWVPIWLAEARAGDRFRFLNPGTFQAGKEYVMETAPVPNPDGSYDVTATRADENPLTTGHEPCSSH